MRDALRTPAPSRKQNGVEGAGYLYGGADTASSAAIGASAIAQFAGLSFTRGDEAEADKWGFQF